MLQIKLISFDLKHLSFPFGAQTLLGLDLGGRLVPVFSSDVLQIIVQIQALGAPPMPVTLTC